jgi:homoserine kinase type II
LHRDIEELRDEVQSYKPAKNLPRGIIHGDLFVDNVRFSHGKLCGVLDFEMSSSGALIYDLCVAICDWAFSKNSLQPELARGLVEGYCVYRPLQEAEKRYLYQLTCFVAARFTVTRIHDFEVMVPPDAERLYKDYRHFLQRLRSLRALGQEGFDAAVFAFR